MPRYRSRSKSRERKARKVARAKVPREKRKLLHWAAKGTKADYERLRKHAHKILMGGQLPGYLEPLAMEDLSNATRATMTRALHDPQAHLGGGLADSISHLLDKVPGHQWSWANALAQAFPALLLELKQLLRADPALVRSRHDDAVHLQALRGYGLLLAEQTW